MLARIGLISLALVLSPLVLVGETEQIAGGSGVLAVRGKPEAAWMMLHSGDALPSHAEFRVSPARPARITIAGATMTFAPETTGQWNSERRELTVEFGQVLLKVDQQGAPCFLSIAGAETHTWKISGDAEVMLQRGEREILNVITGNAESVTGTHLEMTAPSVAQRSSAGVMEITIPQEPNWAERLLRWAKPSQGMGQLIAKDAQGESPVRLEVARYRVNVVLQPPVALIQIDQSFYNPYGRQEEGTFVFNLPAGASVSRFAMFVTPEQLIEGELFGGTRLTRSIRASFAENAIPRFWSKSGTTCFG